MTKRKANVRELVKSGKSEKKGAKKSGKIAKVTAKREVKVRDLVKRGKGEKKCKEEGSYERTKQQKVATKREQK